MYFSSGTQLAAALSALAPSKAGQFLAFDALFYSNTYMLNGNTTGMTAIEHFVQFGAPAMAMPNPTFDPAFYKQSYADLSTTDLNAADLLYHFMQYGLDEGRVPNATLAAAFDADAYLAEYPSVAAYVNANLADFGGSATNGAIAHYVKFGMAQGFTLPAPVAAGTTFSLTAETAAGADVMRLTGDQAARIDFTANDNQVKGLDLDADGTVENNGVENNNPTALDNGKDFEIVDAYRRDLLNENNIAQNYLGNIAYDGTGFAGDGVNTDGNIFLGGLGADIALGGIGNDFLAGGGVAQTNEGADRLDGGRNADFFFAELSLLDNTDGNGLTINGGSTSDDAAVGNNTPQDADWLLFEASDDEDGTVIDLSANRLVNPDDETLDVVTGAGQSMDGSNVEHVDASGNLYGFLDDVNVAIGGAGKMVNGENVAIGASAQLHIIGSSANNILIGGYDNDLIEGLAGADLLMGGNLNYAFNNVNAAGIVNNGMDELIGGAGADNIVFEADGGIVEGASQIGVDDDESDTLWLTRESWGTSTAADMTTDSTLRLDLAVGKAGGIDNSAGYGGADAGGNGATAGSTYTADQTNYADADNRVQVQDMESVIATGLGAVDYLAAGTNDPELNFNNQQNHRAFAGNLDLRGTAAANTFYAAAGDDVLEGRTGDDMLSGGEGNDDFVFDLENGDDLDVIWRQTDADNDNLWDVDADGEVLYGRDFGVESTSAFGPSELSVDFTGANLADANVWMGSFSLTIGTVTFAVTDLVALKAVTTVADLAALANTAFQAIDSNVTVTAVGNVLTVTDSSPTGGRNISDTAAEGYAVVTSVTAPGTSTLGLPVYVAAGESVSQDRLVFAAYDDRLDGEMVDDDADFGGDSLGANAYAQDLVVGFDRDGSTVLAESQAFQVDLENLAVEDEVTVDVNGVKFTLTVGRELDNTLIANETTQAFALRLSQYINDFLDDDTAAGKVLSTTDGTGDDGDTSGVDPADDGVLEDADGLDDNANTGSFILTQDTYGGTGEETVFMTVSVNVDDNSSNGEGASTAVTNLSATDITLFEFSGRDGAFNADNVLFVGDADIGPDAVGYSSINRSVLATGDETTGGALNGSDAIVVHVKVDDDITSSADESITAAPIFFNAVANATTSEDTNYAIHGDDQLIGGSKADIISAGTGDDRIYGSLGADRIDGGKNLYLVDGEIRVLNAFEAAEIDALPATIEIRKLADSTGDGDVTGADLNDLAQNTSDFDDTLVYQQSDFGAVGAGGAVFNIAIDLSDDQANGGSGRVITNGAAANTALFVEVENLRTVSGDGTWVGQGDDTLDLSTSIGINRSTWVATATANNLNTYYDLTDGANAGQIWLDRDEDADADTVNYLNFISIVDGVENVKFGGGDDYLEIDQTEAGKDNDITGGLGDDIVSYSFDIAGDNDFNPAVTLTVNGGGADIDHVNMTGAALGLDNPLDVLASIETINFNDAMHNPELDDTLDVTNVTDAVVDFVNGQVRTGAGAIQVDIGNMVDFEVVEADFNDTVIVSDAGAMDNNSRGNVGAAVDVTANSFLNYDEVDADDARMTTADLRAANRLADIPDAENIGLFQFNLGQDTDRMDYSMATDTIVVAPNLMTTSYDFSVLVDNDNNIATGLDDAGDRIDVVTGVEQVVASQGTSIIDLTANVNAVGDYVNKDVIITYMAQADAELADAWDAADEAMQGNARYEFGVRLEDASTFAPFETLTFVEYRDADAADDLAVAGAYWNRIEGSDGNETVQFTASQEAIEHTLNLRGGDNTVLYNLQTNGVGLTINSLTGGVTSVNLNAKDASGAATAFDDTVTSYNNNDIAAGSLTIYGSTLFRDSIDLASVTNNNVYLLGNVVDGLAKLDVTFSVAGADVGLSLIGFENLVDGGGDDVYQMIDLENFFDTFEAVTDTAGDIDTLQVYDDSLVDLNPPFGIDWSAGTITVSDLEDAIDGANDGAQGFDFDVLDISELTDQVDVVNTDDAGETLIFGDLGNFGDNVTIGDVQGFEVIKFSTVTGMGNDVVIDMDLLEFRQADGTVLFTFDDASTFDFSAITSNMTVNVVDAGAAGVTIITDAVDVIAGADGDDHIIGGVGADTLSGGFIAAEGATLTVTIPGVGTTSGAAASTATIAGVTLTTVAGAPATELQITANADVDQIGQRFADVLDATWIAALQVGGLTALEAGALDSVDWDAVNNRLVFTFDTSVDGSTILAADLTGANTPAEAGTFDIGVTAVTIAEAATPFVARDDSADTFDFADGDTGSSAAASDTITDWDATDIVAFQNAAASGSATNYSEAGAAVASFADAVTAANLALNGTVLYNFQFDATNGYLFRDTDANGTYNEVITFTGIDNTDFAAANIVAGSSVAANAYASAVTGQTFNLLSDGFADTVTYDAITDGADTIIGFVSGSDEIVVDGALETLVDDVTLNAALAFVSAADGNGAASEALDFAVAEAAFINLANNAGGTAVTAANLSNVTAVAAQFAAQFTEANGVFADALLVLESSDVAGTFGVYYWSDAGGGTIDNAGDTITLLGIVSGDGVTTADIGTGG